MQKIEGLKSEREKEVPKTVSEVTHVWMEGSEAEIYRSQQKKSEES